MIALSLQGTQFNKDELELVADALRFTVACLGMEMTDSCEQMKILLKKVEILLSENRDSNTHRV